MANNENLKPVRTKNEARERGRNGGKKSGEVRRRKADFRKTLNLLLTTEIDSPEWTPVLEALGLDSTLESAMLAAQGSHERQYKSCLFRSAICRAVP
mgnify:CR=1 FL=1